MASPNSNLSPRQKMINLMYIVLTAMLALNVSSDVLNGFKQVDEGRHRIRRYRIRLCIMNFRHLIRPIPKSPELGMVRRQK